MMRLKVLNIHDVAAAQLCTGCGACAAVQPNDLEMVDTLEHGRRPMARRGREHADTNQAMAVCPGVELSHKHTKREGTIRSLEAGWGPVLEVWEGYASDEQLRFAASSGGAATALALFAVEQAKYHGVLHITARADAPYLNTTVLSRSREELMAATGSRYAPASPCDGLGRIEDAPSSCVLIGKPCDIAAADKARRLRPQLDERLGLTIAIFCAGTPTTRATLRMIDALRDDDSAELASVRYRGLGWPGRAAATWRAGGRRYSTTMSYDESWGGILTHDKQWRCSVCVDHSGEFADIAVGDPWYRPTDNDPGRSLVLVRTERGRRMLARAMAAGYLRLQRVDPQLLPASQPNLLRGRGAVWGRLWALRLLGLPRPRYQGFAMARFWLTKLTWREKAQSIIGTFRRVRRRRLHRRATIEPLQVTPHQATCQAGDYRRAA